MRQPSLQQKHRIQDIVSPYLAPAKLSFVSAYTRIWMGMYGFAHTMPPWVQVYPACGPCGKCMGPYGIWLGQPMLNPHGIWLGQPYGACTGFDWARLGTECTDAHLKDTCYRWALSNTCRNRNQRPVNLKGKKRSVFDLLGAILL